jgi:hypothetical protein
MTASFSIPRNETRLRRSLLIRLSAVLIAIAALGFCATAAAEVRTGESTVAILNESPSPEATLVKGSASYDTAGTVDVRITTAAPPQALLGGLPNKARFSVTLLQVQEGHCDAAGVEAAGLEALEAAAASKPLPPIMSILGSYGQQETLVYEIYPRLLGVAKKTVSGATTTLEFSSVMAENVGLTCAYLSLAGESEATPQSGSAMFVALNPVPLPPAPAPSPIPPVPGPAPAQLSILKPKRLELQLARWKTVKLKVTNAGGTVTAQGSLRVKTAKGITVKPASQKLPALNPGDWWTVSVRIKASDVAKATSILPLTASAPGVDLGTGSLLVAIR